MQSSRAVGALQRWVVAVGKEINVMQLARFANTTAVVNTDNPMSHLDSNSGDCNSSCVEHENLSELRESQNHKSEKALKSSFLSSAQVVNRTNTSTHIPPLSRQCVQE
uniref:Uncharacterized protein n=1 Tax=Lygus hesperus TaxID=30085 RepID=A0A146LF75_LYGHE